MEGSQITQSTKLKIVNDSEFMKVLKTRVNDMLNGRPGKDDPRIYLKSFVILLWMFTSYMMIFISNVTFIQILGCLSFGVATGGLGFNLLHDSIHGSLSSNKKVNQFFSFLSCCLVGAGHYFWRHKHNYLHHQYPNIQNWDDDLETRDGMRLGPDQPWSIRYKYQHIYAPFIYGLTTLEWFLTKDYVQYFTLKMNKWQAIPKMKFFDHIEFWVTRAIYYSIVIVIPLTVFSLSKFLVGFFIFNFILSLTIASIFQLAHVMEECEYPEADKSGQLDRNWVQLQLSTTVNFAPTSKFLTWFTGGLNYQVEHHLFPNISHTYYPQIAPVLKKTCEEFNYPYKSIPTYWGALKSHFRVLKKLGYDSAPKLKLATQPKC